MDVRNAEEHEVDHLARLWYDGWQDAHAKIVPVELARVRTLESFRDRLRAALPGVRVGGPLGTPDGFAIVKEDELYQMYVAAAARGTGRAAALMADAEAGMVARGVELAWLVCAIGNHRAARFYEKCGWRNAGAFVHRLDTTAGEFALEAWRFEKRLARRA